MLNKLLNNLWEADPGYFRIKHSCKTILAIILTMLVTWKLPLLLKFFSGIASGFSMQGVIGDTRREQIKFFSIALPIYWLLFIVGSSLHSYPIASDVLLIFLGFIAVYIRRFGPEFFFAPIIAWSLAFISIIFPVQPQFHLMIFGCLLIGFVVSFVVYIFIFPKRNNKLFETNLNLFFKDSASTLQWLAKMLITPCSLKHFEEQSTELKQHLFKITMINGDIAQKKSTLSESSANKFLFIYTKQYALIKVLSMILEGFENILRTRYPLSEEVRSHLFSLLSVYATAISNLNITVEKSNHSEILTALKLLGKNLNDFQIILLSCLSKTQRNISGLININLGLRLILQNLESLEHFNENE